MPDNEHGLDDTAGFLDGLVGMRLERRCAAAAPPFVCSDEEFRAAIRDPSGERIGREAAKDHRMDRADSRTSQHRIGCFGNHRQIDRDRVALLDPMRLEDIGETADLVVQFLVGDMFRVLRIVAFPNDCNLFAFFLQVTVEAVVGEVDLAAGKPLGPGAVPVEHAFPRLEPVQLGSDRAPECFRVGLGFLVETLIFVHAANVGLGAKIAGAFEDAVFVEYGVDIDLRARGHRGAFLKNSIRVLRKLPCAGR